MNKDSRVTHPTLAPELPFELYALENAVRYQQWIISTIEPYLGERILEIGAGIGNMSRWLTKAKQLILTESDPQLMTLLKDRIQASPHIYIEQLRAEQLTTNRLPSQSIDTIVSFNVLEHIEDDAQALHNCAQLLRESRATTPKRIISFVPAHQWAYGVMDKQVSHYRRYDQRRFKQLHRLVAPEATLILKPFNFIGLWGWILNGKILKREAAGTGMIKVFETLCPAIAAIDKLVIDTVKIPLGQSLLAIQEFPSKQRYSP